MRHTVVGSGHGGASSGAGVGSVAAGGTGGGPVGAVGGGSAVGTGGGSAYGAGDLAGQSGAFVGLVDFGSNVAGQSDQDGQSGPYSLTMSDLISSGSVEGARHGKERGQLLHNVSGLPAGPIVNAINTLSGKKEFDQADWATIAATCQAGQFEMGLLGQSGNVLAMFTSKGETYVKATNAAGLGYWLGLNAHGTTTALEAHSQQDFESPDETAVRLESIAKAATTPLGVSNFMGTGSAYQALALPIVLSTEELQFDKPSSYTGVTAPIPDSSYMIVGAKFVGQGVSSSANIGNNISLPSSLQASLLELVTKLNEKLDSLIFDDTNLTQEQQVELQLKISDLISNPKDILEFISGFLVGYNYGNQYVSNYNNAGNSPPLNNLKLINVPPPENSNSIKASVENGYYLGYWVGYNITLK
jgi:hypothetical protein